LSHTIVQTRSEHQGDKMMTLAQIFLVHLRILQCFCLPLSHKMPRGPVQTHYKEIGCHLCLFFSFSGLHPSLYRQSNGVDCKNKWQRTQTSFAAPRLKRPLHSMLQKTKQPYEANDTGCEAIDTSHKQNHTHDMRTQTHLHTQTHTRTHTHAHARACSFSVSLTLCHTRTYT